MEGRKSCSKDNSDLSIWGGLVGEWVSAALDGFLATLQEAFAQTASRLRTSFRGPKADICKPSYQKCGTYPKHQSVSSCLEA